MLGKQVSKSMAFFGLIQSKKVDPALVQRLRDKGYTTTQIANAFGVKEKDMPKQVFKIGEGLSEQQKKVAEQVIGRQTELSIKQPTKLEQLRSKVISPTSPLAKGLDFAFPQTEEQRVAAKTFSPFDKDITPEQKKLVKEQIETMGIGAVASLGSIERQIIRQAERSLGRKLLKEESKNIGKVLAELSAKGQKVVGIAPEGVIIKDVLQKAKVKIPKQLNVGTVADDIANAIKQETAVVPPKLKVNPTKLTQIKQATQPIAKTVDPLIQEATIKSNLESKFEFSDTNDLTETIRAIKSWNNDVLKGTLKKDAYTKVEGSYGKVIRYNVEDYNRIFGKSKYTKEEAKNIIISEVKKGKYLGTIVQDYATELGLTENEISDIALKELSQVKAQEKPPVLKPVEDFEQGLVDIIMKEELRKAEREIQPKDFRGEMENQYDNFVGVMEQLNRNPKLREQIDAGDVDTFKRIASEKGLLEPDAFGNADLSDAEIFDKFKARLMQEKPQLLATKDAIKKLGITPQDIEDVKGLTKAEIKKIIEKTSYVQTDKINELDEITTRKIKQTKEYQDWAKYAEENLQDKDIRPSLLQRHSSMTAERVAEFFDEKIDGQMYNRMIKPVYDGAVNIKKEGNIIRNTVKEFNVLEGSNEDIGASLYAQKLIPDASAKSKNFAKFSRNLYDDLLVRLNTTRAKLGVEPIPKRQDYVTHLNELNVLGDVLGGYDRININQRVSKLKTELLEKHPDWNDARAFEAAKREIDSTSGLEKYIDARQPAFRFAKKRLGEFEKNPSLTNSLNAYTQGALRYIYQAENVAKNKAFKDVLPPNAREFMRLWNTEQVAGRTTSLFLPAPTRKIVSALRGTFGANTILGNMATTMMQLTSLPQVVAFAGVRNTMKGLTKRLASYLSDSQGMYDFSRTKATRSLDVDIGFGNSLVDSLLKKISQYDKARTSAVKTRHAIDVGREFLKGIMETADQFTVGATYETFYLKGIKDGMLPEKAMEYADIMTGKTQANYFTEALPPFLATTDGKILAQFGTYGMNQWEMFKSDFGKEFGLNEKDIKSKNVFFKQFLKFLVGAYLVDSISEKTFGRQPFDIKDLVDEVKNLVKGKATMLDVVKQSRDTVLGYLPYLSSAKFGTMPPVLEFGSDVISAFLTDGVNSNTARRNLKEKWALQLLLPYGGNQIRKTLQGLEGTNIADIPLVKDVTKDSKGKAKWKIEGLVETMKAILFGSYATQGARDFYEPEPKEAPVTKLKLNVGRLKLKPTKLKINKLKFNPKR